ncbi:MAG: PEP-CTERM sorting domain-containing protein [Fimbriimonadales bacterium]|nr:PEP-CTERM sorting domain-containing protein [Fimbriimonadales bacterium]
MRFPRMLAVAALAVGLAAELCAQPAGKPFGRFQVSLLELGPKPPKIEFPLLLTPEAEDWLDRLWERSRLPSWMTVFEVEWDSSFGRFSWPLMNVYEVEEPGWRLFRNAPSLTDGFIEIVPGQRLRLWFQTPRIFGPPPICQGISLAGLEFGGWRLDGTLGFDGWVSDDGLRWSGEVVLGGAPVPEPATTALAAACLAAARRRRKA